MREMRKSRLSVTASILALTLGVGACDEGLTEINQNPNAPEDVPASNLFAQGIFSSVSRAFGANFNMTLTDLWAQHVAKIQYIDEDRYDLRDATVNTHWNGFYSGPLRDFQGVIEKGEAQNLPNVEAQGLVMRSWLFQILTDVWGDIPYSEALKGTAETPVIAPVYDPQQQVYAGIFSSLTEANSMINAGGVALDQGDLVYGGDMTKWKRFANSLRLRAAMRLAAVDPAKARTEAAAAVAAGVFQSNADNASLGFTTSAPSQNPLYLNQLGFGGQRDDHAISATIVDTLKSFGDPRLSVYAAPASSDGTYRGMKNGVPDAQKVPLSTVSRVNPRFFQPNAPARLQTYAEVLFLQAEAAQRGWIAGDAATLYRNGIRAAMEMYGVPAAEIDAYLAQARVQYNPATGLQQIALQKWIALFMNGPEAFAEVRRTNFPQLTPAAGSVIGARIPSRIFYPSDEQSYNLDNLKAAVDRNGGMGIPQGLLTPVWWDK